MDLIDAVERLKKTIVEGGVSLGKVEQAVGKVAEGIDVYLILAVRGGLKPPEVGRSLLLRHVVSVSTKRRERKGASWMNVRGVSLLKVSSLYSSCE